MEDIINYITANWEKILFKTYEHLWLTFISIAFAIIIGVTTGILLTRFKKTSSPVLGFVGMIQTIPSLALLGFMIPLVGIGAFPAIIALFLYALLPIVRNTFTGIEEVSQPIKEAGTGLGMNSWQLLTRVELPLALPTIFAGIRTSTVINIGVATLCALIAAGGLGEFIFTGIALNNIPMILAGAFPAAFLAILLDFILSIIQRNIRQIQKPFLIFTAVVLTGFILFKVTAASSASITAGFSPEFAERDDGWKALKDTYNIDLPTVQLNAGLMYMAVKNGRVDLISGYTTDGRIKAYELKVLEDDKNFFPPYYVAPVVRAELFRKYPLLKEKLDTLRHKISDEKMQELNYKVDHNKQEPKQVALEFLRELGFDFQDLSATGPGDITIGSKNFTEQYILAHIYRLLITNLTDLNVDMKVGLGGTKICFEAIMADEIDMYPEYTGTGFLVLLDPDGEERNHIIKKKDRVYQYVKVEFKKQYDLEWLSPLGFSNSYALMMRKDHAAKLQISTISDLADYVNAHD